jgi:ferredoxin--NADP+ reductase
MSNTRLLGSPEHPLRVAVIGSGPAGFYVVQQLFDTSDLTVKCDVFERLPTPFGLVRLGVAPDHQKTKSVVKVYHKLATNSNFRFFGDVEYGKDIFLADLQAHCHCIVFTTGAQADRHMNIPGENLTGSHAATEFVAWYNGHPDYSDRQFDLTHPVAVIVGMGNVSIDVARILVSTTEELKTTDIADYALKTLQNSGVKEVYILGRRGPGQAAFTNPEILELGRMTDAEVRTLEHELIIDENSQKAASSNAMLRRKLDILQDYAAPVKVPKSRRITLRFLTSPLEVIGDHKGNVKGVRTVRNELSCDKKGRIYSTQTDQSELIEAGLILRSVGYKGKPLIGLPFLDDRGVVPNDHGRVIDPSTGNTIRGVYVSGWIKRGARGVIGTNKGDAKETVANLLVDLRRGAVLSPQNLGSENIENLLSDRKIRYVSYKEWQDIDRLETEMGVSNHRPRVKFTSREEIFKALDNIAPLKD